MLILIVVLCCLLGGSIPAEAQAPPIDSLAKAVVKIDSARARSSNGSVRRWLAEARALLQYRTPPPPVPLPPVVPPPPASGNAMFFNSAEAGCGTDPRVLFCDDFEDGDWYPKHCDAANASGGLLQTDGWCGNIWKFPGVVDCGGAGVRSNCAARQENQTMADHSLSAPASEVYVRFYTKPLAGYAFGAEKVLSVNKDPAGFGGIYWGNLHLNCGAGAASPSGLLQWQAVAPEDACLPILALTPGHWTYVELHLNVAVGVLQIWADDCGADGTACPAAPTLRVNRTGWRFPSTTNKIASLWFEQWSNPSSSGVRLLDQIKVSTVGPIGF